MKNDLATTIFTAIVGVIIAYFVCNMILPEIPNFTYKALSSNFSYSVSEPNPEIFNFRAVNPTVEVYVGQCESYDINGNCIVDTEISVDPNLLPENVNNGESNGGTD